MSRNPHPAAPWRSAVLCGLLVAGLTTGALSAGDRVRVVSTVDSGRVYSKGTLVPGPYRLETVEAGDRITLRVGGITLDRFSLSRSPRLEPAPTDLPPEYAAPSGVDRLRGSGYALFLDRLFGYWSSRVGAGEALDRIAEHAANSPLVRDLVRHPDGLLLLDGDGDPYFVEAGPRLEPRPLTREEIRVLADRTLAAYRGLLEQGGAILHADGVDVFVPHGRVDDVRTPGLRASTAEAPPSWGSHTPRSRVASAFESYIFQSPDNGWPEFLTSLQQQGYVVQHFTNETFDDDPEAGTISNLVAAAESGVLGLLHAHGNTTGVSLEVYKKAAARDAAFEAYLAAGWNRDGAEIAKSDFNSGWYTFHNIRISKGGFSGRIKPRTDPLDALIYAGGVCNSVGFIDDMGGRVRFGNDGIPGYWKGNLQQFFRHMSGAWGEGEQRSAGAAFAMASAFDPVVRLHGAAETTLCPTVRSHSPSGPVTCPGGRVAGRVEFDTALQPFQPAAMIALSSGVALLEASWVNPGFEIAFEIGDVQPGEVVTLVVDADSALSAANGTRLDGNRLPVGSAGVRPNGDDFVWTFQCTQDPDVDLDGVQNAEDNCPSWPNAEQGDADADGVGDACDVCPDVADPAQADNDADSLGDACDADDDNDGVADVQDRCPCDADDDADGDGVCAGSPLCDPAADNCPAAYNPGQPDFDGDGAGDACDSACAVHVGNPSGLGVDCVTVQDCIDRVPLGCDVVLSAGVYHENLVVDKPVRIRGEAGAGATIVEGLGSLPVVEIVNTASPIPVALDGVTLRNGPVGMATVSDAELDDVVIEGATVGLHVRLPAAGPAPRVELNRVTVQDTQTAVLADGGVLELSRSWIREFGRRGVEMNGGRLVTASSLVTDGEGSGVWLGAGAGATIAFATITRCAVGVESSAATGEVSVQTSIVRGNVDAETIGLECSAIYYSDIGPDCCTTNGNACLDPRFVDPEGRDYRLSERSLLLDMGYRPASHGGEPCLDHDGRPRLLDANADGMARPDPGAYEYGLAGAVPGAVERLRWAPGAVLVWAAEGSSATYQVYRGDLDGLGYDEWGTCRATSTATQYADPETPEPGRGFFYLVVGQGPDGTGTAGYATCAERSLDRCLP